METLREESLSGFIYTRQDEDGFLISANRVADGRKRLLNATWRLPMFRDVITIALIDLHDTVRVMPVEWRQRRASLDEQ